MNLYAAGPYLISMGIGCLGYLAHWYFNVK